MLDGSIGLVRLTVAELASLLGPLLPMVAFADRSFFAAGCPRRHLVARYQRSVIVKAAVLVDDASIYGEVDVVVGREVRGRCSVAAAAVSGGVARRQIRREDVVQAREVN